MKAPDPVDGHFDALQGEEAAIARSLRALVRSVAPSLQEGLKWRQPVYTGRRNVCCIAAEGDHVKLGILRRGHLSDPEELLEGTGKAMRQVKVRGAGDVPKDAPRSLLQEAVALDEEGP